MTQAQSSALMQLQYCPVCRRLIRPSMLQNQEAVFQDNQCFHVACLAKGKRDSGRAAAAPDFDNEEGVATDFGNYDQDVAASITGLRHGRPATGSQVAVRRKTTASAAAAAAAQRGDDPPAARRSSMVLRSYTDSSKKKGNPAMVVGVVIGLLALVAVGGLLLLNSSPDADPQVAEETHPAPPTRARPAPAPTPVPLPSPTTTPTPAANPTTSPGAEPQLSPYELAQRNQKNNPPAEEGKWEPAGPKVALFDGQTLDGWKVVKVDPAGKVTVQNGAMEIVPAGSPFVIEHPLSADNFDLTFEARMADGQHGCYAELWVPQGVFKMTAADFQSDQFTPVTVQVRDGKLSVSHTSKGGGAVHPGFFDAGNSVGDRVQYLAGRNVMMFFCGSSTDKSFRNFQFTPMRPVAAPTPTPAPAPVAEVLALPVEVPCTLEGQTWCTWHRVTAEEEAGKKFISWSVAANTENGKILNPFFDIPGKNTLPDRVVVHLEYRLRNSVSKTLTVRLWGVDNATATEMIQVPAKDQWQTADLELKGCNIFPNQLEIRLEDNPGPDSRLDLAVVSLRPVGTPVTAAPTAAPTPLPTPAPAPGADQLFPLPATIKGDLLIQPLGEWKRMARGAEAGKEFIGWERAKSGTQAPYFSITDRDKLLPARYQVKIEYRVQNNGGEDLQLRIWSNAKHTSDYVFPGKPENAWITHEIECVAPPGAFTSLDLRLDGNPGETASFQVCSIVLTPVAGVTTAVPTPPQTPPTPTPAPAPAGPQADLKFGCGAMSDPKGEWFRVSVQHEGETAFIRWEQQKSFLFFRNAGKCILPLNATVKVRARLKNNDQNALILRMYVTGKAQGDQYFTLGAPDADGWCVGTLALKNDYTDFREFEIKSSGQHGEGLVMEVDSIDFLAPAAVTAGGANTGPLPPTPPTALPLTPVPATPAAAAPGAAFMRFEGVRDEKGLGSWQRCAATTEDGRSVLVYQDLGQHQPMFLLFKSDLPFPTKILVRASFRVNKPCGNVRIVLGGRPEDTIAHFNIKPEDVGTWQERDFTFTPTAGGKSEIYLKYGSYPADFKAEIDSIEIFDLTKPAPTAAPVPAPGGDGTATAGNPGGAVSNLPAAGQGGQRLPSMPAGQKKLTHPNLKVYVQPNINSSLTTPGMAQRLFDGDTAGGIFSMTNPDPAKRSCWLVFDLGEMKSVSAIKLWNFFNTGRTYGGQVWQLCPYDDFQREVVTVYNSDGANANGQGAGTDTAHAATKDGVTIAFSPVRARFVRIFGQGNSDNGDNHILEVEVWGQDGVKGFKVPANVAAGDLRLNAGRENVPDWSPAGVYCLGGSDMKDLTKGFVGPTTTLLAPDALFTSYRGGTSTWKFPKAPDGNYWVRLYFNEPQMAAAEARLFDVVINDETMLKNYDIFKVAGGAHRGVIETLATEAKDGKGVVVEFKMVKGAPLVCAVELLPTAGPQPAPKTAVP